MAIWRRLHVLIAVILWLVVVEPADAGCCTIVTVDTLPRAVHAGEPVEVGFTVRARGAVVELTALSDESLTIFAHSPESGESFEAIAQPTNQTGTYVAELTFPHAGTWEWGIAPAPFPVVHLESLTVLPPSPTYAAFPVVDVWTIVALAMLLASGLAVMVQRRQLTGQAAIVTGIVGLAILLVSIHVVSSPPPTIAAPGTTPLDDVAYGRALFVAKGCTTCHVHAEVPSNTSMSVGPNLTTYDPNPDFVRRWLRDPKAIRPKTFMPDLNLSEAEIDALIAFLDAS